MKLVNEPISGVKIFPIIRNLDDRGFFSEIFRKSLITNIDPQQISYTMSYPSVIKAFHYHKKQFDYWFSPVGNIQVALVDIRQNSDTYGHFRTIFMGENGPQTVLIPPGVAHGYKVLGNKPAGLFYVTSEEYNPKDPDEHRIPWDHFKSYNWETKNR